MIDFSLHIFSNSNMTHPHGVRHISHTLGEDAGGADTKIVWKFYNANDFDTRIIGEARLQLWWNLLVGSGKLSWMGKVAFVF